MAGKVKKQTKKQKLQQETMESVEVIDTDHTVEASIETAPSTPNTNKKSRGKDTQAPRSTRYAANKAKVDPTKTYSYDEAINLAKETATTKFIGSIEVHINTNQKSLRGFVKYPHATGKKKQILVFGQVKEQDGLIIGDDKSIESITKNTLVPGKHFDTVIATPAYMPKLAKIAKILGPRGLMPSPKSGTVTDNPERVVSDLMGGKAEYKTEANAPIIHGILGKADIDASALKENLEALVTAIGPTKIINITVNATMGPGILVK